jgi:Zn-dependent protease with chaperone function
MYYFRLMSLYLFLIVVTSLASGSVDAVEVPLQRCVIASTGLILAWGLLAKVAATVAMLRVESGTDRLTAVRAFERHVDILRWVGLAAALTCLVVFNLAGAVQTWPVFAGSMFLQALVLLSPGLSMIALTLVAEHQLAVGLDIAQPGLMTAIREVAGSMMRFVGWMVAPVLAMLAFSDLIAMIPSGRLPWADGIPSGMAIAVATILGVPVLVPLVAKRIWRTRPIVEPELAWIREMVIAAGVPSLEVRIWNTGMKSANAVVVGFFPRLRSLLLTDRLIAEMPSERLSLIVLHEVAHVRRGHLWIRMLSVVPAWLVAAALLRMLGTDTFAILISNALAISTTLMMLRISSHTTEFDADRAACELAVRLSPAGGGRIEYPSASIDGLSPELYQAELFCKTLISVTGDSQSAAGRSSWLHPSVDARCRRLLAWAEAASAPSATGPSATMHRLPGESPAGRPHSGDAPFSNAEIQPILCGSAAGFAARETR